MDYRTERMMRKNGLLPKLPTKKDKKPLKKVSDKRAEEIKKEKENNGKSGLDKYFGYHMANSKRVCDNCGKSLKSYKDVDWRGSQHHVLDKAIYPSIKSNLLNHMVLGRWCCHSQWHTSWENAAKMKVFPMAIDIIQKLYPFLKPEEKRKLPVIVLQELNTDL